MSGFKNAMTTAAVVATALNPAGGITENTRLDFTDDEPTTTETCKAEGQAPSIADQYMVDNPGMGLLAAASTFSDIVVGGSKTRDEMGEKTEAAPEAEYADTAPPEPDSTYAQAQAQTEAEADIEDVAAVGMNGDLGDDADDGGGAAEGMNGDLGDDADDEGEAAEGMNGDLGDDADDEGEAAEGMNADLGDDGMDGDLDGDADGDAGDAGDGDSDGGDSGGW